MPSTESQSPRFAGIETWRTEDAVEAMLEGQLAAVSALSSQTATIASACEAAADRLRQHSNGRLIYAGAGTSGRIAVQDGVELYPTFGWPNDRLAFVLAGGADALVKSQEGAEDDRDAAISAIRDLRVTPDDVLIGVAASGRTPFTVEALQVGRTQGALTIAVTNNAGMPLTLASDYGVIAETGSELVAGSTRMKAGTAQKVVLNLISTTIMLRLGRVYRGLMVDMVISNDKLMQRAADMVARLADVDAEKAHEILECVDRDIKTAVLVAKGATLQGARESLIRSSGNLGQALLLQQTGIA